MSIKNIDNIDYKGKQQNFKRDSFDTIGEMRDFSENFLPDIFEAFCYETQKKYRFNRNNSIDPVLSKWREVIDGSSELPKATKEKAGVVQIGSGLSVKDGVINADKPEISSASGNALSMKKDGLFVDVPSTDSFVKKEWGKGLSSNDLTDELKDKILKSEVNIQPDWNQLDKTKDDFINNKPTKLSDFTNDKDFITNVTKDLVNYYQKSQVYTKAEIQSLINIVNQIAIKKVDKLPTENIDPRVFYLVRKEGTENDMYEEYMYVDGRWEVFGISSISFQEYYTKEQCEQVIVDTVTRMIENKVDKEDGKGLSDENFTKVEKDKLASLENYDDSEVKEDIEDLQYTIESIADTAGQAMTIAEESANEVSNLGTEVSNLGTSLSNKINTSGDNATANGVSAMINTLTEGLSDPADNDYYVSQYAGGGSTNTSFHRRPVSKLWNYIKTKTDSVYNGKITLTSDTNSIGDDTTFILGGNATPNPTSFVRRTGAKIWEYIKGKLFSHNGTAIDANANLKPFSSGYYNNAPKTYSTDNQGCGTMLNIGYASLGDSNTWNNQLFFPAADASNGVNQKNMFWYRSRHNSTGYNAWQPIGSRGVKSQYSASGSVTGGIKVQLPDWDNVMFTMWIDVYDYSGAAQGATNQRSMSIYIGGYAYESKYFYATQCTILGGTGWGGDAHTNIFMGQITNGGAPVIQIGSDGTVWTYPKVTVRNVQIGHTTNINTITKWIGYDYPITQPNATLYNYHTVHTSTSTDVYRATTANSASTATSSASCTGHAASDLALSGGTMTGRLNAVGSRYLSQSGTWGGINLGNSDIIGVNGIYTSDLAEGPSEGLNFKRSDNKYDSVWAKDGILYFTPANTVTEPTASAAGAYTDGTARNVAFSTQDTNGYPTLLNSSGSGTWIRAAGANLGFIPYQSGGAGSGHGYLGTSTWYFANAYIDQIHGYLNGNISGSSTSCSGNAVTVSRAKFGDKDNEEHNCNNALTNGLYYYTSNGPATTLGASSTDGSLYVQRYNDTWVSQIAQDYRNGRLFVRGKNNGSWSSWLKIATSGDIPTSMAWTSITSKPTTFKPVDHFHDLDFSPLSNGTVTGVNATLTISTIASYNAVLVVAVGYASTDEQQQYMLIPKDQYKVGTANTHCFCWTINGTTRRLIFQFTSNTQIKINYCEGTASHLPKIIKIYGVDTAQKVLGA